MLAACGPPGDSGYRGSLYFIQGSYLMRYDLRDGALSAVTNLGNKQIREISPFGESRLLISETTSVNRKRVAQISWMDLDTGRSESLYPGVRARYLPDADAIVYDDGRRLYSVAVVGDVETNTLLLAHRLNEVSAMVSIPGGRLLLGIRQAGEEEIHLFDIRTNQLDRLDALTRVCRLEGAVWISDEDQLACPARHPESEGASYVLADLLGAVSRPLGLPEGESFTALTFLEGQGALILKELWESRFSEQKKAALWAHDIATGENVRLSEYKNLGASVVYAER
jgi:hypothetical protein